MLNTSFCVPSDEKYRRKQHEMKILGKAGKLLCDKTYMKAKRRLRRCTSEQYKKVWQNLQPGSVFSIYFGAYIGAAFLAVGGRHLEKKSPRWISQQREGHIFEKIAENLFRFLNAHFVAHTHKDTVGTVQEINA